MLTGSTVPKGVASAVDLKTMSVVKRLLTEANPTAARTPLGITSCMYRTSVGDAEAVVDVDKDETVKTLKFISETGMPQYDPVARKLYVNLQDKNIFAVIDPPSESSADMRSGAARVITE